MEVAVLLGLSIILGVAGQILLKEGVRRAGGIGFGPELFRLLFTPLVFGGFFLYGLSSVIWLMILSRVQLSIAYPMLSLGYILVVLAGWWFLKEAITAYKIIGVLIIMVGVFVITR